MKMKQKILNYELCSLLKNVRSFTSVIDKELEYKLNTTLTRIMFSELHNPINTLLCDNFDDLIDEQIENEGEIKLI